MQVGSLAGQLRSLGVSTGDRIAIVMPAGPEMALTFLAATSVAVCAPLNPAYRSNDFEFYLDDLAPKAVILTETTASPVVDLAKERGITILRLSRTTDRWLTLRESKSDVQVPTRPSGSIRWARPEDVALLLHTSGTTSRPKIVPLSHENLCVSARQIAAALGLSASDRCLNVMPLFHIHGLVGGLLSVLVSGGSVVCAPGFQAECFLDWALQCAPSWYTAVPTIHQSILDEAERAPDKARTLSFRFIRSSSAALAPTLLSAMERRWEAPVVESYGMTEASHQMTTNPLPPRTRKPGSVGVPAGPEVAVMDDTGALLAQGHRGEVVIRGRSVTLGYVGNPDANQAAFHDGWFRTGDEGYFDADGYLFLTGRLKEMINRGGECIAPREIDEALMRHEAVAQAVAFAAPHETLGDEIVAAVVFREGREASEVELRHFLARHLTDFKVPSRIVSVASIPKGPTGKLQRIGLHERLKSLLEIEYEQPASEEESWVATAFGNILGHARVGRNDNFFALGGDSLRAVRVVIELATPLGRDLPITTIFEYPTPALLGAAIKGLREADAELDELARALSGIAPEKLDQLLSGPGSSDASS